MSKFEQANNKVRCSFLLNFFHPSTEQIGKRSRCIHHKTDIVQKPNEGKVELISQERGKKSYILG